MSLLLDVIPQEPFTLSLETGCLTGLELDK